MPFSITCAACQKTFSIADDVYERKVKGRVVTIKCKQCHAGIRVDGTKESPVFSLSESVRPPAVAPTPAAVAQTAATPAEAPGLQAAKSAPNAAPAQAAKSAPNAAPAQAAKSAPNAAPAQAAKSAPNAAPAQASKAAPSPLAAKSVSNQGSKPQPVGLKLPPAAPAVKGGATLVAAAPNVPSAAVTPKAPPAGVRAAPAAAAPKVQVTAPVVATPLAAPPAQIETLWAVDYPDGEDRELTLLQIKQALASGAIDAATLVWREGMAEWLELGQVAELRPLIEAPKPAALSRPKAASAPELTPQRAKAASAPDLGLQRPRAPSAPELTPQRPKAASAPDLGLQRPRAPSAPELTPQRPKAASAPDLGLQRPRAPSALAFELPDLPPTVPQAPAPPVPVSEEAPKPAPTRPSFPAPSNAAPVQPLAVGGSQPFAAAKPTPPAAPVTGLDEYPAKSKAPLIIGLFLLLAIAAGAIYFLTRPSDALPPPSPISALPPAPPAAEHTAIAEPEVTQDAPAAPRPRTSLGPNAALEPPSNTPQVTPNAGFAELFANGARNADENHRASGPTQRFDPAAAKAALANAASSTAQCREKDGPAGKASVVVTFEPSGKVSTATVSDAPFAGTPSGVCIAQALKKASVPPFSGLPGTVTKIISIQ